MGTVKEGLSATGDGSLLSQTMLYRKPPPIV